MEKHITLVAAINIGLNFLMIPYWGIIGAAIATVIAYAITASIIGIRSRKYMTFDLSLGFIAKSVISSGLMALALWALQVDSKAEILIAIIVGSITYFILLFMLGGFSKKELGFIFGIYKGTVSVVETKIRNILP